MKRRGHRTFPVREINYKHYCGHLDGRSPGSVSKRIEVVKNHCDHNFIKYLVIILFRYINELAIPAKFPFLSIDIRSYFDILDRYKPDSRFVMHCDCDRDSYIICTGSNLRTNCDCRGSRLDDD